jgi:hypothetical protein
LKEHLSNIRLRVALRERGLERAKTFSWERTAELVWKSLHEL